MHKTEIVQKPLPPRFASASLPRQPAAHPLLHCRREPGPIVSVAALTDSLGLGWVRMNDGSQFAQADPTRHRHTDLTDHLAGMARHDRCSQDFIPPLSHVEFHETVFLAV